MTISPQIVERMYKSLRRIRRVEEEIIRVYPTDKITSPVHLSIGQEAVSVGVCEALTPDDVVFGNYRGHALYLAKGGDLNQMIAELYGKVTGCARGKGGSMHLTDVKHGVMGMSAVVGSTIPVSVGYAYALKLQGKGSVVASFFGDGAVEEGVFVESVNFAALKRLPVLFVCENNLYAIHSHIKNRQANTDISARVRAMGVPAERFENDDVFKIHSRAMEVVAEMRAGKAGPHFFECMTYRWKEHVGPGDDYHLGYRKKSDAEQWIGRDQVKFVADMLKADSRAAIEKDVEQTIAEAFRFAETSPFPVAEDLYKDVFKEN